MRDVNVKVSRVKPDPSRVPVRRGFMAWSMRVKLPGAPNNWEEVRAWTKWGVCRAADKRCDEVMEQYNSENYYSVGLPTTEKFYSPNTPPKVEPQGEGPVVELAGDPVVPVVREEHTGSRSPIGVSYDPDSLLDDTVTLAERRIEEYDGPERQGVEQ